METISFPHFSRSHCQAQIALFRNVSNGGALKKRIIAASTMEGDEGEKERASVNYSFVNAKLITSKLHLQTAIYQSILAEEEGSLRTKTVHSEILYNLNPTHNITEAIRRYGVGDDTTDLIVVQINSPDALPAPEVEAKLKELVTGDLAPFSDLALVTDWSAIKKYHKLNNDPAVKEAFKSTTRERMVVDEIVVSSVAMKTVMN
ncbi:hypothetical protein CVT24_004537 [Panaeolus cyanescens]|uniref:EKC/KEOPS complex subunit CGI121 n=1 Tax=Panaeolus cyanescens TaxID=181874 RepID=A0A409YBV4_9AGAR|nr:hypothetical protein CVT24_004537 [Panaeolus cyanescens]